MVSSDSNLRIFSSLAEIGNVIPPSVPKLILTVPSTLSYGYSRALFLDFARNPLNLVLLTSLSEPGTLARWLAEEVWEPQQDVGAKYGQGKVGKEVKMDQTIELEVGATAYLSCCAKLGTDNFQCPPQMRRKVYLEGEELEAHLAAEAEAAEMLAKQQAALDRSRRMMQENADGDSDSDSDSDGEAEAADAAQEAATTAADEDQKAVGPAARRRRIGGFTGGAGAWDEFLDAETLAGSAGGQSFDIYVRGSYGVRSGAGGGLTRFRMFPVVERKRRVDAYGEQIDVEGWLKRGQEDDPLAPGAGQNLGKRAREEEPEPEPEVRSASSCPFRWPFFFPPLTDAICSTRLALQQEKPEPPHKYVVDRVEVPLQASVFVVDMEGLSDGRALKTILPQINPRKLVRLFPPGRVSVTNDLSGDWPLMEPSPSSGHRRRHARRDRRSRQCLQGRHVDDQRDLYACSRRDDQGRRGDQELFAAAGRQHHGHAAVIEGENAFPSPCLGCARN